MIGINTSLKEIGDDYTRLLITVGQHIISMQAQLNGMERDFLAEAGIKNIKRYLEQMSRLLGNIGHQRLFSYTEPKLSRLELSRLITDNHQIVKEEHRIELEISLMQQRLKRKKFLPDTKLGSIYKEIGDDLVWIHNNFADRQKKINALFGKLSSENKMETRVELKEELVQLYELMRRLETNMSKLSQAIEHLQDILKAVENSFSADIKVGTKVVHVDVEDYNARNKDIIYLFERYGINIQQIKELKELVAGSFYY